MDNVVTVPTSNLTALNTAGNPVDNGSGLSARWQRLSQKAKINFLLGMAALLAVAVSMAMWSRDGDYKVLYANLSDKDGGAIIGQLSQMNIPYKHADGGNAILVPAGRVHDARLRLATVGLPKSGVAGFELMDNAKFGQTQFQERLTFQRGLEGELTRTILAMPAVSGARVHLALPSQNGFFREQQKPSASVMLTLQAGRSLDNAQVAGIVHLVASSVPELNPKAVSVLDQSGALLSSNPSEQAHGLDAQQLQYVHQIEDTYTKRIMALLEPIVGAENLRATVTAEVDFSQSEATSEEFRPNQGEDNKPAIRSAQTSEFSGQGSTPPAGVPGATSNQPPAPAVAPVAGTVPPLQAANAGGAVGQQRREATTHYEVDKTVRVVRNATGSVKRVNAAVVVNHKSSTDAKGKTTTSPLGAEDIEKITALVTESIGFKKERGDSVRVINVPFKVNSVTPVDTPMWKQPEVLDLLRSLGVPIGISVLGLVAVFGLIRPAMKGLLTPPPPSSHVRGGQLDAVVDGQELLPAPEPALPAIGVNTPSAQLERAKQFAKDNPAAVAQIVRHWVSGEGS